MTLLQSIPSTARKLEELIDVQSPSSPVDYFLPSNGIRAGTKLTLINSGTATLTVLSSSGQSVTTIGAGLSDSFISLIDAPTLSINWKSISGSPDPTTMSDAVASKLGYKTYLHNDIYNNSQGPSLSLSSGGGTLNSVGYGFFVPHQKQDGSWWMDLAVQVILNSQSRTVAAIAVNGCSFGPTKAIGSAVSNGGGFITFNGGGVDTGNLFGQHPSQNTAEYYWTGRVPLLSKPIWVF